MDRKDSHAGTVGWAALGAGVFAWDVLAPETLSHAVDRCLETKIGRVAAPLGALIVGAHVLNLFEHFGVEKYDPFNIVYNIYERVRHG